MKVGCLSNWIEEVKTILYNYHAAYYIKEHIALKEICCQVCMCKIYDAVESILRLLFYAKRAAGRV